MVAQNSSVDAPCLYLYNIRAFASISSKINFVCSPIFPARTACKRLVPVAKSENWKGY